MKCIFFFLLISISTYSQQDSLKFKMIKSVSKELWNYYVSEKLANEMIDTITQKFKNNLYDSSLNLDEFAFELTKDLRRVSRDNHISVSTPTYKYKNGFYDSEYDQLTPKQKKKRLLKQEREWQRYKNTPRYDMFLYGDIKILPGNIGYVEIKNFYRTSHIKKQNAGRISIASVMQFLKDTKSIIFDLRDNQGGYTMQTKTFCSYFSPVMNNYFISTASSFRYDSSGVKKEMVFNDKLYTDSTIDDLITKEKKIYVLISKRTFSAAELAAYKIKQYRHDIEIVGEKTCGGGNGHGNGRNDEFVCIVVPDQKAFDESNGNFSLEAVGVTPDIAIQADSAYETIYRDALKNTMDDEVKKGVKYFKKNTVPPNDDETHFRKYYDQYVGEYFKAKIIIDKECLYLIYDDLTKLKLIPEAEDYFTATGMKFIRFRREKDGKVSGIFIKHTEEFEETFRKMPVSRGL
jgi:hypothetical protein